MKLKLYIAVIGVLLISIVGFCGATLTAATGTAIYHDVGPGAMNDYIEAQFSLQDENGEAVAASGNFVINVRCDNGAIHNFRGRVDASDFTKTVKVVFPNLRIGGQQITLTSIKSPVYRVNATEFIQLRRNNTTHELIPDPEEAIEKDPSGKLEYVRIENLHTEEGYSSIPAYIEDPATATEEGVVLIKFTTDTGKVLHNVGKGNSIAYQAY
jgi:hypothetical protein